MHNLIIEVSDASKTYKKGKINVHALRKCSLQIKKGEFIAITGRSGSGKSTLLNLIGGLDVLTQGSIKINGSEMASLPGKKLASHRRFTVGMIFQSFNLIPSYSAAENISLALAFGGCPRAKRKEKALHLLNQVGLSARADHKPAELSGGEMQRVSIARALANSPDILLADEPTGNLDSTTANEVMAIIQELNRTHGITVIMVTHDQLMAREYAHRIIDLKDGKVESIIEPDNNKTLNNI